MKVHHFKPSDLTPYASNPRQIPPSAVDAVKSSIEQYGFKNPIIVDSDKVVVAGHTRLQAAIDLGLLEVPVIIADDLTPEQIREFRIVDNRTSEYSDWDLDKLLIEIDEMNADSMIGFTDSQFEDMLELNRQRDGESRSNPVDDDQPEVQSQAETEPEVQPQAESESDTSRFVTLTYRVPVQHAEALHERIGAVVSEFLYGAAI